MATFNTFEVTERVADMLARAEAAYWAVIAEGRKAHGCLMMDRATAAYEAVIAAAR